MYISVPPHKPNIIDEHGTIVQTITGPYEENEDMKLQCLVSGGEFSRTSFAKVPSNFSFSSFSFTQENDQLINLLIHENLLIKLL